MNIYKSHRHNRSVGWSFWHLEWCTKYRYKIFTLQKYKNFCKIFLQEAAKRYNIEIIDVEVDIEHIHLIVSLPPRMLSEDALQYLKGFTSKCLFIQMPYLKYIYSRRHLWSPGRFNATVGYITLDKAKQYLEEHHAKIMLQLFCLGKKI